MRVVNTMVVALDESVDGKSDPSNRRESKFGWRREDRQKIEYYLLSQISKKKIPNLNIGRIR